MAIFKDSPGWLRCLQKTEHQKTVTITKRVLRGTKPHTAILTNSPSGVQGTESFPLENVQVLL